jgi:capsular exopolysaccharide synthesis family protein
MELAAYFEIIKRRAMIIIITTVVAVVVAIIGYLTSDTTYESTATLRIVPYSIGDPPYSQLVYAERVMNTYVEIATSQPVLERVVERLGLGPNQRINVTVEVVPDSELIRIIVQDTNPNMAANIANTLTELLLEERPIKDIQVYVIEPATTPYSQALSSAILFGMIVIIFGLAGGVGLAFLIENIDTTLFTTQEFEQATGLSTLGEIPIIRSNQRLTPSMDFGTYQDPYNRLRTNIFSLIGQYSFKTLIFTSAEPNNYSPNLIANLAYSISLAGRKTVIIDADMHHPAIHQSFGLENETGLSQVLSQSRGILKYVLKTEFPGILVLPSGSFHNSSTELLGSSKMLDVLQKLWEKYDLVLINAPAILEVADSLVLAPLVDAIVLVCNSGITTEPTILDSIQQLEKVGGNIIGIVVNGAKKPISRKFWKFYQANDSIGGRIKQASDGIGGRIKQASDSISGRIKNRD